MAESEMGGFVFAITFILIFSTLLASVPAGLQGTGSSVEDLIDIDPSLITGFEEYENYTKSAFNYVAPIWAYQYNLGGRDWVGDVLNAADDLITLKAKVYWWILWLGQFDSCKFISPDGVDRGISLAMSEIEEDAVDGEVRYTLQFTTGGETSPGSFVAYWNTTVYTDPQDAWDNDVLYMIHGVGFGTQASNDVLGLILGLLFFSLPDVPVLVNALIAFPIWACIIFLCWYFITSLIPFVSGP